jgi:hypothetical protein
MNTENLQFYSQLDIIWQVIWIVKLTLHAKSELDWSSVACQFSVALASPSARIGLLFV